MAVATNLQQTSNPYLLDMFMPELNTGNRVYEFDFHLNYCDVWDPRVLVTVSPIFCNFSVFGMFG